MEIKKPKYSEKDFEDMMCAPCFGEFKPPRKTAKKKEAVPSAPKKTSGYN